ncbi:unnamed protein product [Symbiodinium natans]|uniref:Acyltransferase 3 domain-containing protein n=1 Tax=Symbiodinium natans TaxID=878477 RepID=A0A812KRY4_9DINO|nr:unnamed protein product [Symbiodinium natans]
MAAGTVPALHVLGDSLVTFNLSKRLDNARFILMVLVVLTHTLTSDMPGYSAVLGLIHPFQTRALAFISGVVSRKGRTLQEVGRSSRDTAVQILVFSVILDPVCHQFFAGKLLFDPAAYVRKVVHLLLFSGEQIHWYLFGLLWWRLLSSQLEQIESARRRMAVSLMVAALATYHYSTFLSVTESLACWPFYVAGDLCGRLWPEMEKSYKLIRSPASSCLGVLAFLGMHMAVVKLGWTQHFPFSSGCIPWAMQEFDYDNSFLSGYWTFLLRGCLGYLLMFGKIAVFLVFCCPDVATVITPLGRHSIFPYLLHYPAVPVYRHLMHQALSSSRVTYTAQAHVWVLALLLSILAVSILSSTPVRALFGCVLQPFRRQDEFEPAVLMPFWARAQRPCPQQ